MLRAPLRTRWWVACDGRCRTLRDGWPMRGFAESRKGGLRTANSATQHFSGTLPPPESLMGLGFVGTARSSGHTHAGTTPGPTTLGPHDRGAPSSANPRAGHRRQPHDIRPCRSVGNFKKLNLINEGTYGRVWRAQQTLRSGRSKINALKEVKMEKEKEGFPMTALREIHILLTLQHLNVVCPPPPCATPAPWRCPLPA